MDGKVLQAIVEIAGSVSPTLSKSVKETCEKLDKVNVKALAVGAAVAVGTVAIGKATIEAGKYLANLGDEYNQAINDISATTGAVGDDLAALGDVVKDVYGSNFGESMGDVASGVAEIHKQTGLTDEALAETTKAAYALSDTFGYEVTESARAAKAMMTNFGVTGEEAMNLIAAGAQNGLDFSGEMIDSINEYSVQFAKLGFSADDMFNIFQQGADSGAWNLDKVGDAVKEFSIRSIDGSKTTMHAFESLGMNADEMMKTFAAGGDGAADAFQDVLGKLIDMDDAVARDAIGVELFGTQWEDLGVEAMSAMADMQKGAYASGDALSGIMDVKYNNITDAFEAIKRQAEVSLLPLATTVTNAVMSIMPIVSELFESLMPAIEQTVEGLVPVISNLAESLMPRIAEVLQKVMPVVLQLVDAILPVAIQLLDSLMPIFDTVLMLLDPILNTLIAFITPILNVISALSPFIEVVLTLTNMALKPLMPILQLVGEVIAGRFASKIESIIPVVSALTKVFENVIGFIKNVFTGNWEAAWDNVVGIFSNIWEAMKAYVKMPINYIIGCINGMIKGLNKLEIPDWVPGIGGKGLNIPLIPQLAAGGFTDGISIAGEAGMEAVISFDPAYRDENIDYWLQAGRMLGIQLAEAESGSREAPLLSQAGKLMELDDFSLGQLTETTIIYYDFRGLSFSPNVEAGASANKEDIIAALKEQASEFFDWLDEWLRWKEVGDFDRVGIY